MGAADHPPRRSHRANTNNSSSNGKYQQSARPRIVRSSGSDPGEDGILTNEPKLLPQSELAERALIGAALSDERTLDDCAHVRPRYFFRHAHQIAWEAMQELHAARRPIDYISVSEWLAERGRLADVGGVETLIDYATTLPPTGHAPVWAETVCKRYYARFMLSCNAKLAEVAYRGDFDEMKSAWALQYLEIQEVNAALGFAVGESDGPRHKLLSLAEMRARPRPEWIIPGLLHERKRVLIFGDSNTGKSYLALDLGLSVAALKNWHGREIRKGGAVVFVCAEGADDVMNRVDLWLREHQLDDAPDFWIIEDSPNLLEMGQVSGVIERINNTLGDEPPALVIFDTLASSMPGGDENAALDMGIVIGAVHRVQRECQCGVMVVHHSGKDDTKGPRGSSALRADVDLSLHVTYDETVGIMAVNGNKWRNGDRRKISYGFRLVTKALDAYGDLTSCILEESGKAFSGTSAAATPAPHSSPAPASGRLSAPDRLFALMQEIAKPLRDVEWSRLFVERNMGSQKTYEAAIAELRKRHVVLNVNGAWVAEGVL